MIPQKTAIDSYFTDKGNIEVENNFQLQIGNKVFIDGQPAPDGNYEICLWFITITVKQGVIIEIGY
jgi:hypothetical protein